MKGHHFGCDGAGACVQEVKTERNNERKRREELKAQKARDRRQSLRRNRPCQYM